MFNRIYRVYIQAEAPYRAYRDNLNLFFVRGSNGTMIPVTSLGTTDYTTGPGTIKRFNMFNSATVTGEAAHGYSSGQAMKALEEVVHEHLPPSVGVEWSGLSYQEKHEGGKPVSYWRWLPVRFSVPCRTVRELVDSGSRPAFAAGSRYRGLHGHLAVRPRE